MCVSDHLGGLCLYEDGGERNDREGGGSLGAGTAERRTNYNKHPREIHHSPPTPPSEGDLERMTPPGVRHGIIYVGALFH